MDKAEDTGPAQHLCLTDLLDQDPSSYEFFYAQPPEVQEKIRQEDPVTLDEMQAIVSAERSAHT